MTVESQLFAPWPAAPKKGWLPSDIDVAQLTWRVDDAQKAALLDLVDRCKARGLGITDITLEDFRHPRIDQDLAHYEALMKSGPGFVFLSGLPYDERPLDDIRMLYWGVGTHFGRAVSQNRRGEKLGEVRVQEGMVVDRAYGHSRALQLHSDRIDLLSLMCVRKPLSGGENIFASSLKIWEIVETERPDVIPIMRAGFRQHRMGEHIEPGDEATSYRVPVFGEAGGLRSVLFSGNAAKTMIRKYFPNELTEVETEALDYVLSVRDRKELEFRHTLELGDAIFINNYEVLHNREAYVDGDTDDEKRRLLRLWMEGVPERPKPEEMIVMRNPSGRQGIDAWSEQRWAQERAVTA